MKYLASVTQLGRVMGYNNQKMNVYMKNRWIKRRAAAVGSLGGKCVVCGTTENLEFDHVDSATKGSSIAHASSFSQARFDAEVAKCQLLCRSCHEAKTLVDRGQESAKESHGTLSSYKYCKCDLCKKAKADYMSRYWSKHRGVP